MTAAWQYFLLAAPLFSIVLVGYAMALWRHWRKSWTQMASKLVFTAILPALLFHIMSDLSSLPPVDARLLIAFFGSCFVVFVIGRLLAARVFKLDGVAQSVFALGGIFSNNVLLGLPLARLTLGEAAVPAVALVLVFNSLVLWSLVSVSVEWARHGSFTVRGFGQAALSILTNPIIVAILLGTTVSFTGMKPPQVVDTALGIVGHIAAPAALLVLGMGLTQYSVRHEWRQSMAICTLKLIVQPLVVWILATALGLPPMELKVVVLLASIAVGANVYLMASQFQTLQGPIAGSLVLSTALAAFTTPLLLAVVNAVLD